MARKHVEGIVERRPSPPARDKVAQDPRDEADDDRRHRADVPGGGCDGDEAANRADRDAQDRKSTRLNSSHSQISYAVFCLKKKKHTKTDNDDDIRSVQHQLLIAHLLYVLPRTILVIFLNGLAFLTLNASLT